MSWTSQDRSLERSAGLGGCLLCVAALLLSSATAVADPGLRKQVDQNGDFALFGNTIAFECSTLGSPTVPAPVVGTVGNCLDANQTAPDVYFRADDASPGQARAADDIGPADARSTAVLKLPAGASVTYARLYWAAYFDGQGPDRTARIERPGAGLDAVVDADVTARVDESLGNFWYQSSADVSSIVMAAGPGAFRISDVGSLNLVNLGSLYPFIGWYMVVFYEKLDEPTRNLALFDGLDEVSFGNSRSVMLSGFLVPPAGFDAKLGVVAFEGDPLLTGDALQFGSTIVSDAQNPADNFFNATRSFLGMPVSNVGDLPQLTGGPRSMAGMDMDVVDVTPLVTGGQTQITISATTNLDTYLLAAFVTSVSTLKPDFHTSQKTLKDLDGGAILPGDELEYEIAITNTGSDASVKSVITDPLPAGVSLVTGSIEIVSGPGMSVKTEAAGDDQAEYDAASRTIRVRFGTGADATNGGSLAVGATLVLRFHVTVDPGTHGVISNQGAIRAAGERGSPEEQTLTDGNGSSAGSPPTEGTVEECDKDKDCKSPTPRCDVSQSPHMCVGCVTDTDCKDPFAPVCDPASHICRCMSGQPQCKDTDGDGLPDETETSIGSDPNDADTDDDGVSDGKEIMPDKDPDGDGLIDVLDADSDNDGLFDGTEQGFDCTGKDVDLSRKRCRPDQDRGATTTDPINADTDGGGVRDGSEDVNLDGAIDAGETDPTSAHGADDKRNDQDGDGLSDGLERTLHSDPNDADSDDDGLLDGAEANPSEDTDADGLLNVLDVDSDDDALYDGTELGKDCSDASTDTSRGHCRADADAGKTKTSPLLRDTDKGSASDGSEDASGNGLLDSGERDPTAGHGADDKDVVDTDGDGLGDELEKRIGTNPLDADSDDDGVRDGKEPNPADDHDGDGLINALDPDSDDDGLHDGTELGLGCNDAATDTTKGNCTPDADGGATKTSPVNADTDYGGKRDGTEDPDKNGRIDPGELDPNDPRDDMKCASDADCGDAKSGLVCNANMCQPGCRGQNGNGCANGQTCSSTTSEVGMCRTPPTPIHDAGTPPFVGKLGGGGCGCRVATSGSSATPALGWLGLLLLAWATRARTRRRRPD